MASRLRFLRPVAPAPVLSDADMQKMVYDLVLERAQTLFGPTGSFAITIRKGDEGDDMFAETVAETLAWDVSLGMETAKYRAALERAALAS